MNEHWMTVWLARELDDWEWKKNYLAYDNELISFNYDDEGIENVGKVIFMWSEKRIKDSNLKKAWKWHL